MSEWLESLNQNMVIKDKIFLSFMNYAGIKKFLKRFRILRVFTRLLFKKNILNIVIAEDIDSQNDIRKYLDLVEQRNSGR